MRISLEKPSVDTTSYEIDQWRQELPSLDNFSFYIPGQLFPFPFLFKVIWMGGWMSGWTDRRMTLKNSKHIVTAELVSLSETLLVGGGLS